MKTFRMIGMALFAVLMCVNFTACGGSDDEDKIAEKTTFELLKGTWYNESEEYSYFIVNDDYCYFSETKSTNAYSEKYKYTFNHQTNIMTCYQFIKSENVYSEYADYFMVEHVTDKELILNFLDDEDLTVTHAHQYVRK